MDPSGGVQKWRSRPYTRRALLAGAGIGAAVVATGGVGAALLLRDDGTDPQATPRSSTAAPSETPTSPTPGNGPIQSSDQSFEVRRFADGERIPWHEGVFAMETDTGNITGYRFMRPPAAEGAAGDGTFSTSSQEGLTGSEPVISMVGPTPRARARSRWTRDSTTTTEGWSSTCRPS